MTRLRNLFEEEVTVEEAEFYKKFFDAVGKEIKALSP